MKLPVKNEIMCKNKYLEHKKCIYVFICTRDSLKSLLEI